jgi:hypothetical protein
MRVGQRQHRQSGAGCGRGNRICGVAIALGLTVLLAGPRTVWAEPPTTLDVPEDGGRPVIPGETPPPPDRQLPVARAPETPPPSPVPPSPVPPSPVAPIPQPETPPEPRKPLPPWQPTHALQVEVGPVLLPSSVFSLVSRFDKHPQLRGMAIDLSWWSPLARNRWLAVRLGLGLPNVPTANWYESKAIVTEDPANTAWRALYTRVGIVTIDLAVDYVAHVPITDRWDWTLRAGLGMAIQAGNVDLQETLPSCTQAEQATCPHWRQVGQGKAPIPLILPMLRATTGLSWRLTDRASLGIEAGLRDVLWAGASAVLEY